MTYEEAKTMLQAEFPGFRAHFRLDNYNTSLGVGIRLSDYSARRLGIDLANDETNNFRSAWVKDYWPEPKPGIVPDDFMPEVLPLIREWVTEATVRLRELDQASTE